jgi:hypothetical protein
MKTFFTRGFLLFILAVSFAGTATAQFTISGEFRPRAEYRNGYLSDLRPLSDAILTAKAAKFLRKVREEDFHSQDHQFTTSPVIQGAQRRSNQQLNARCHCEDPEYSGDEATNN